MDSAASLFLVLTGWTLFRVSEATIVTSWYGETIVVPCNGGAQPPQHLMFVKWTYVKDDGAAGELLIKQGSNSPATIQATDEYAQRISIDGQFSLHITHASIKDQRVFTCMVVSLSDRKEYSTSVLVKKKPSSVNVFNRSEFLEKDKLTTVGSCVAAFANPAANITWNKNGKPLEADGKAVITSSVELNPATGLSTTSSTLQYAASKEDADAVFSCMSTYLFSNQEISLEPVPVHYPSEKVSLQIMSERPIKEGENVTLRCSADGNPPPSSFFFSIKGQKHLVENSDKYTLASISREDSGEVTCSLEDNEDLQASTEIFVNYLDLTITPTGRVVKEVGDSLPVLIDMSSSGNATAVWTKNQTPVKRPEFTRLTFADAGSYTCFASIDDLLRQQQSFHLVVEGKPVITNVTQQCDGDKTVLTCEAEGAPQPKFQWSIDGTKEESNINGKVISKVPIEKTHLNVTCRVSNTLGEDVRAIYVSSECSESSERLVDHPAFIPGVVVVFCLLLFICIIVVIVWKKRKSRKRNTGSQEDGTPEERMNMQTYS